MAKQATHGRHRAAVVEQRRQGTGVGKPMDRTLRIAQASIAVGLAVLALKTAAWQVTGSAAFYSDALETVVNVAASAIAYAALRFAARPADDNHPYGHDKAEFLAAVVEGALIVIASVSILQHAWGAWRHPHVLNAPAFGTALSLVATAINAAWAGLLMRTARKARSPALLADARHLIGDVAISVGVVAGVGLVLLTGVLRLDAVVGAATAVYVLWSGIHVIGQSMAGLMDMAPTDDTVQRIERVLKTHGAGAIEVHDIRARQAGRATFVQFHLVVPGAMRVDESHAICDRIEAALHTDMEHLVVNIHVEPEHKAKHAGAVAL